jgi:hypothetical protein
MRLPFPRFVAADGVALVFGHSLLFFLAFWFGDSFKDLVEHAEQRVDRVKPLLIVVLLAVMAGLLLYHFLRRPISTADPHELPIIGDKVLAKIDPPAEEPVAPPPGADGSFSEWPRQEDHVP